MPPRRGGPSCLGARAHFRDSGRGACGTYARRGTKHQRSGMSTERDLPSYMDPAFLRGLTEKRISRRTALQGAGAAGLAAFLAACGVGSKAPGATHTNWVWDKAVKAGVLDFANWPLYIDTGTDAKGKTTYPT